MSTKFHPLHVHYHHLVWLISCVCFEHDIQQVNRGEGRIINIIYMYVSVMCRWSGAGIAATGVGCECVDHLKRGIGCLASRN